MCSGPPRLWEILEDMLVCGCPPCAGWRVSARQENILSKDFGAAYCFSQGYFWLNESEVVSTRACHMEVQEPTTIG
jgi:hypothetical protein